jgi:hypothetical protein
MKILNIFSTIPVALTDEAQYNVASSVAVVLGSFE